jgi:hypothetical protein
LVTLGSPGREVGEKDGAVRDEPEVPPSPNPGFEAPHPNGAVHQNEPPAGRKHPPWEFLILTLLVLLLCVGIILGWTLVGSKSPEKLDATTAAAVAAACNRAQAQLKALPDPDPSKENGTKRAARVRAENVPLRAMVGEITAVRPPKSAQAAGLLGWTKDWSRMLDARDVYATSLERLAQSPDPNARVRFIYPATNAIRPITQNMDDYVRESTPRLDACFTEALQLEVVEGPREYKKVTR